MKRFLSILLALVMVLSLVACGDKKTPDTPDTPDPPDTPDKQEETIHIGIVTGSVSQSEDDRRGAEAFQQLYGEENVTLVTYPDNFTEELETTIQCIVNLSDDPDMKAIIVNQSVPGTTEAFRKIKERRPDILCIAGEAHEDLPEIGSAADLVCNNDFVARGYLIIRTAHELDCDTFVHISFPRHLAYETMSRRIAVMKAACEEFGMKFEMETAPDPTSDVGVAGAQAYILEKVPEWASKYGEKAAYFCTNDAHTEPLLKQLLEYGGYFIEADLPSPLMGYPGALGIDLTAEAGDFQKILAKVEAAICEKGGAGRFGTWAYSYGYVTSAGLAQHAMNVIKGESELADIDDIAKAYHSSPPTPPGTAPTTPTPPPASRPTTPSWSIRIPTSWAIRAGSCTPPRSRSPKSTSPLSKPSAH